MTAGVRLCDTVFLMSFLGMAFRETNAQEMQKCWGLGKFHPALNPCGFEAFNCLIQKSSRFFSLYFGSSLSMLISFNCLINKNFAYLLKLWPGNQKCCLAWSKFCLFTSFPCLFNLKVKVASCLLVYCLFQNIHSIRCIRYLLLQLSLLYILKVFCATVSLKRFVNCTCVQHKLFNLEFPGFQWPF